RESRVAGRRRENVAPRRVGRHLRVGRRCSPRWLVESGRGHRQIAHLEGKAVAVRPFVRLCGLAAFCAAATVVFAQAPVKLESRVDPHGNGEAIVTNLKSVPLTAYVLQVFLEPCSPTPRPDVFRVFDAVPGDERKALAASESHTETVGAARCNK